ncbi:MAG TPA: hypothetical protein VKV04_11550 [Verrucomicrobiae bacterium]|nr:hypothetical protein [Verrucomicrobiae bacterium]
MSASLFGRFLADAVAALVLAESATTTAFVPTSSLLVIALAFMEFDKIAFVSRLFVVTDAIVFVVGVFVADFVEVVDIGAEPELLVPGNFCLDWDTVFVSTEAKEAFVFESLVLETLLVSGFVGGRDVTAAISFVSTGKDGRSGIVTPASGLL